MRYTPSTYLELGGLKGALANADTPDLRTADFAAAVHREAPSYCDVSETSRLECHNVQPPLDLAEEDFPLDFGNEWFADLRLVTLTPHSGLVGCGVTTAGRLACWAGGRQQDPYCREFSRGCDARADRQYDTDLVEQALPAGPVCVDINGYCWSDGQGILCRATGAQAPEGHRFGRHFFRPPEQVHALDLDPIALTCGADFGPLVGQPPYHRRLCLLDIAGQAWCALNREPLVPVMEGTTFTTLETSLALTCGLTAAGKVRCLQWPAPDVDAAGEPRPLLVPKGLRP